MSATAIDTFRSLDAPSACLNNENLHRLMSIWDIVNRFQAVDICVQMANLGSTECNFLTGNYRQLFYGRHQVVLNLVAHIMHASRAIEAAGLYDDVKLLNAMQTRIAQGGLTDAALVTDAQNAKQIICGAMGKLAFLFVSQDRVGYIDQEHLFGEPVSDAFPSARSDIRDAGNCLATECSTAAVFHLMRVAEYGLRALANDRQVVLPKNQPLDLASWEELLRGLESAEQAIQQYPKTLARERQYEFYHGAMMELRGFKNKFRNSVMHTRDEYDRDEGRSAFTHVRDFMKTLATEISETKTTPMIWS